STFSGNMAGRNGGAISNLYALTVNQCTLSGNKAGTAGGGIYNTVESFDAEFVLLNSIVVGNTVNGAADDLHGQVGITRCVHNVVGVGGDLLSDGQYPNQLGVSLAD